MTRLVQIIDSARFDIIFLQRDLVRWSSPALEKLVFRLNSRVVFDLDDAQWIFSSKDKIRYIAAQSAACCMGNRNLQEFLSPIKSRLLPTIVDVRAYPVKQHEDKRPLIIGWTGTTFNYPFFSGYRALFERLLERGVVELNIISNGGIIDELKGLPVNYIRWSAETELDELIRFDIGIMPLPDTELTRYKCGLKLVQYHAAGIPSVASAIGANNDIILHDQTGYLCHNIQEWQDNLAKLINSTSLRADIGRAARARAEASYNAQEIAQQLSTLFESISSND